MSQQLELASICCLTLLTLWGRIWDMKQLVNFHARKTEFFRFYHSSNSDAIDAQKNGSALEGT